MFKIKNEKIYFTNQILCDELNKFKDVISGENYQFVLSTYFDADVAETFSRLVKGKQDQIHFHTTYTTPEGETLFLTIFGYRFQSGSDEEIFGAVLDAKESEKQLIAALKDLSDIKYALDQSVILAVMDDSGKITYVNDNFCEISGYSMEELIGSTHKLIDSNYHDKEFYKDMWQTMEAGDVWKGEIRNQAKDGSFYWVDTTIVPLKNEQEKPTQYIVIRSDITDKKESQEQIRMMAYYDHLTGLANRRRFDQYLKNRIEIAEKNQGKFGMMFIDLDGLKYVNDTLGHSIGDQLLIDVARRFESIVEEKGMVARFNGDEFSMVIDSIVSAGEMEHFAKAIIEDLKEPFSIGEYQLNMTASIGVATFPEAGSDASTMMKHADLAMHRVKSLFKNDYKFFDRDMNLSNQRAFQIKNDLRRGLEENQFYIVYQPKIHPIDNRVTSCEALIRWRHPELQDIAPGEFIPLAEEVGMINEVGDWVIQNVCKQLQCWKAKGYDLIPVSVNLSASQFLQADFVENFLAYLNLYQLNPSWIQIEITESLFIDNEKYVQQILKIMREKGIKVALDDFGTGYSSLAYLQKLDLDILKMDRSLISGISNTSIQKEIAATIVQLGKSLGMEVVAEGVETKAELDILLDHGIDEIQGYYYSKPLCVEDMTTILETKKLHPR